MKTGIDIICLPIVDWGFRFQRPQQILSVFAANNSRVFYLNSGFLNTAGPDFKVNELRKNIYEVNIKAYSALNIYRGSINEKDLLLMLRSFEGLAAEMNIRDCVCMVDLPFWRPLAVSLRRRFGWKMLYDCMDEHSGFSTNSREMLSEEERLAREADLVFASSGLLYEKMLRFNKRCMLVNNAADFRHFSDLPVVSSLKDIKKPVIGYFGAISDWFDTGLIEFCASERRDWSFVLVGNTFGADTSGLERLNNVHLTGERPYADLPAYLSGFDVCIMPYKDNKLTRAMDHVKPYEYLCSGKPVVAMESPETSKFNSLIYIARDRDGFLRGLDAAVDEKDAVLAEKRVSFAGENRWENRQAVMSNAIRGLYPKASIIIAACNGIYYTRLCIESILSKTTYPNYEIIIVDNGSDDGTGAYLRELSGRFDFIRPLFNRENLGFAKAINQGIRSAEGYYIILLNNDVVVTRGWLSKMIVYLDKNPEFGVIGPVTNTCSNEARIDVPYKVLEEMEDFAFKYTSGREGVCFDIKTLALFCTATTKKVIEDIGLLDERFGTGMFEDDDFSVRARLKGYRVVCAEDIFIHHFGMVTFNNFFKLEEYYDIFNRNKRLFEEKWGAVWEPHRERPEGFDPPALRLLNLLNELEKERDSLAANNASLQRQVNMVYESKTWKLGQMIGSRIYKKRVGLLLDRALDLFFKKKEDSDRYSGELEDILRTHRETRGTIVFPPTLDWDNPLYQRPHHMLRLLSKMGYLVFFCSPNFGFDKIKGFRKIGANYFLTDQFNLLLSRLEGFILDVYSTTFYLDNEALQDIKEKSIIVYEYIDHIHEDITGPYAGLQHARHKKIKPDVVFASASDLYEEMLARFGREKVFYMPNAADYEHFHVTRGSVKMPDDLFGIAGRGRNVIGYYGALADWIDYGLINRLAEERPELEIVLIGWDYDKRGSFKQLAKKGNIHYLGPKDYSILPQYGIWFDVAMIPFIPGKIADATSPLKLFEYMAMGKPIVTTDMKECRKYGPVLTAKSHEDFIALIDRALKLKDDAEYLSLLDKEAQENRWDKRTEAFDRAVQALMVCNERFAGYSRNASGKPDKKAAVSGIDMAKTDYKGYQDYLRAGLLRAGKTGRAGRKVRKILKNKDYKGIVLYPSPVMWNIPLRQKPHHILKELSKEGYLVFFLTPDPLRDGVSDVREVLSNLFLIADIGLLNSLKDEKIILWLTWTPSIVCKDFFRKSVVVYDWMDELSVFYLYSDSMVADHELLVKSADILIVNSESLYKKALAVRKDALLTPSGVCLEDFIAEDDAVPEDMKRFIEQKKPVIGFYGSLESWRLDYSLIRYVCGSCRDMNFVFIGPSYDGSSVQLSDIKNLFLLGPRKYTDLRHYLRLFDAAVIPYKIDDTTAAVSPLKLFEYMAGGKPVVATDLKECRNIRGVFVSKTGQEFVENIYKALDAGKDRQYLEMIRETVDSNTWTKRAEPVLNALEKLRG